MVLIGKHGWLFASTPCIAATRALEWQRWHGKAGAVGAVGAALMSSRLHVQSRRSALVSRVALSGSALLVWIAGHLGGTLVRGAGFLRP